eukprot:7212_1
MMNNHVINIKFNKLIYTTCALFLLTNGEQHACIGFDACEGQSKSCSQAELCTLNCDGGNACEGVSFTCASGYACSVQCNGWDSCRSLSLDGTQATNLTIIGHSSQQIFHSAG